MRIPTEYYEEDFLKFEDYLEQIGDKKVPTLLNPHANSQYALKRYAHYEKYRRRQDRKLRRQQRRRQLTRGMSEGKEKNKAEIIKQQPKKFLSPEGKKPLKLDVMDCSEDRQESLSDLSAECQVNEGDCQVINWSNTVNLL